MGTHSRALSESYLMNTKLPAWQGLDGFHKSLCLNLCFGCIRRSIWVILVHSTLFGQILREMPVFRVYLYVLNKFRGIPVKLAMPCCKYLPAATWL